MTKQMSKDSNDGSVSSSGHSGRTHLAEASHLFNFVDGLGPGQLVGRQVLASPCLGEIQLNIKYSKGRLEVEVIRAKSLVPKHGTRILPGECGSQRANTKTWNVNHPFHSCMVDYEQSLRAWYLID